ncbi:hypothetical protein MA16_Dca024459 [Dendrobium catenatum]|uniref:Uncharacterized protein n=1 Tax=Dendrobium catenatum TaxID=906689 RepID=A0A2I0W9Z9_9ASPA|nr:hypothetical protein MA16_Dca024459 [Dendrobium catenatum]
MMGSLGGFSEVLTIGRDVIVDLLWDQSLMLLIGRGGSPRSRTRCHTQAYFSSFFFFSVRIWPPDFLSLLP